MTPGPWTIAPNPVCVNGPSEKAELGIGLIATCGSGTRSTEEAMANARAIAALPDLLEAAKRLLDEDKTAWEDLEAAVAKAEGIKP